MHKKIVGNGLLGNPCAMDTPKPRKAIIRLLRRSSQSPDPSAASEVSEYLLALNENPC